MGKDKELRYRAICYNCGKPFDSRYGMNILGHLCCYECEKIYRKYRKFTTIDDLVKK